MTHDEAFLADIAEHPDEDAPRLVYADWLEDRGERARAEFVRLQCQLARLDRDDAQAASPRARAAELLRANWEEWVGPLRRLVGPNASRWGERWLAGGFHPDGLWKFRRGFVDSLALDAETFIRRGDELFRLAPVRHLRLWLAGRVAEDLAQCPHLAWLATLDFADYFMDPLDRRGAVALAGSPHLHRLNALHLTRNNVGDAGLEALAEAPWLGRLHILSLTDNGLSPRGVGALARTSQPLRLTILRLGRNELGDQGALELHDTPVVSRLRTLEVHDCGLGPAGVAALASSPQLARLANLNVGGNPIGAEGAAHLARSTFLRELCNLNLRDCGLGSAGAEALAGAPGLASLQTLTLNGNEITNRGARALADSPYLRNLRRLDFGRNLISDEGAAYLAARLSVSEPRP
jgi:uncharacterized protein (TIGR02996 family)